MKKCEMAIVGHTVTVSLKKLARIGQNISKDQTSQLNKALDSFTHVREFMKGQRFTSRVLHGW